MPVRIAASEARPPPRCTGMVPTPSMNARVAAPLTPLPVKYSALPRNTTLRFITSGKKIESENDRWFDARIARALRGHVLEALGHGW